jgi:hypothetical protein
MHNAPPVVYPLGRSRFQGRALLLLWLVGLGVTALWWVTGARPGWRLALGAVAVLVSGAAALRAWKHCPVGQLHWDGQVWRWESQGYQAGTLVRHLSVALDFQHVLLLRLENHDGATLWLWAQRASMPERWLELRRAVYSRRGSLRVPAANFPVTGAGTVLPPGGPSSHPYS